MPTRRSKYSTDDEAANLFIGAQSRGQQRARRRELMRLHQTVRQGEPVRNPGKAPDAAYTKLDRLMAMVERIQDMWPDQTVG